MNCRIFAAVAALLIVTAAKAQVIDILNPNIVVSHGANAGATEEPVILQPEHFGLWVNGYTPRTTQYIDIFTWTPQMLAIRNNRIEAFAQGEPIQYLTLWANDWTQTFTKVQFTVDPVEVGASAAYIVVDMPGGPLQDHVQRIDISSLTGPQVFTVEAINGARINMVRFEPNFAFWHAYNIGVSGLTPSEYPAGPGGGR